MKLLLDQGLPRSAAAMLCEAGFDSVHVADIGLSSADDIDILQRAQQDERVVVTLAALHPAYICGRIERSSSLMKLLQVFNL